MPYVYPGLTEFFNRAAEANGPLCPDVLHRSKSGWHVSQVVNLLSQVGGMQARVEARQIEAASVEDAFARIDQIRAGLAVQLAAIDAAVADVRSGLGLDPKTQKEAKRARN